MFISYTNKINNYKINCIIVIFFMIKITRVTFYNDYIMVKIIACGLYLYDVKIT